ncbi:hypothetical protein AB4Z42_19970 [Mycobacterium sp. 2YAF39]|uniref:hypothetical protein n=1 Tax=Mycobacterium sp. 2YAF39 TaxID=3233033 RepID=UPI003F9565D4
MLKFAKALPTFTIADGVEAARDIIGIFKVLPESLPAMRTEDLLVGYGDIADVPVRIYRPPDADAGNSPVEVFFHGGGWAVGDLDVYEPVARTLAIASGCGSINGSGCPTS